ncbi:MAG: endonuclease/exonuclease/phosphatase family protein [Verrucomicrobiota bacterium]
MKGEKVVFEGYILKCFRSFTLVFITTVSAFAAVPKLPIIIDSDFTDWPEQKGRETIRAASDSDYVYLYFKISEETVFQENFGINLYFDTDDDPATGRDGAEIRWSAGSRSAALYSANGSQKSTARHAAFGFIAAPTIDSDEFEIRVSRDYFPGPSASVTIEYTTIGFLETLGFTLEDADLVVSRSADRSPFSDLRLVSYNVLRDGLQSSSRSSRFGSEISFLAPDVLALQESDGDSLTWMRAIDPRFVAMASNSGCQIVSRFPMVNDWNLDGNVAAQLRVSNSQDLLLICVHLPCCSNVFGRGFELGTITNFIQAIRSGLIAGVAADIPIVTVGDCNFVREDSSQIVDFESDTASVRQKVLHLNENRFTTWENPSSSFSPGRLDWCFLTEGIVAVNSFIYKDTQPSDHLPLVFDLGFNTDGDSLPDLWEVFYFGDRAETDSGNFDSDSLSNLEEYRSGTSPSNFGDQQEVRLTIQDGHSGFLTWTAVTGSKYSLLVSDDLDDWRELDWSIEGISGEVSLPLESLGTGGFYRIVVESAN